MFVEQFETDKGACASVILKYARSHLFTIPANICGAIVFDLNKTGIGLRTAPRYHTSMEKFLSHRQAERILRRRSWRTLLRASARRMA